MSRRESNKTIPGDEQHKASQGRKLVFRPNEKKLARVAIIRRVLIWTALGVLGLGVVMLIRYRPSVSREAFGRSDSGPARLRASSEPGGGQQTLFDSGPGVEPEQTSRSAAVRQAAASAEASGRSARDRWQQALGLLQADKVTDEGDAALNQIEVALAILDSAGRDVANAEAKVEFIRKSSWQAGGEQAYRLSVLYVAADKYVRLLKEEAKDQQGLLNAVAASVRAVISGDEAEVGIKLNVATSFGRKSEERQPMLQSRAEQMLRAAEKAFK